MTPPLEASGAAGSPATHEVEEAMQAAAKLAADAAVAGDNRLSVIVPTRNESANVEALLRRLQSGAGSLIEEVIFVDDSTDNTVQVIESMADKFPFPVRVVARPPERRNGLGKAVVEGVRVARAPWVLVMDGDLQHPPEVIPQLLGKALAADANLVAGSRLAKGGGTDGLSARRKFISQTLAFTSRMLFPQRLRQLTDPLTGFFLVRREVLNPDDLKPEGFKILLEVLVRTPGLRVAEVPFQFGERHGGESKASTGEVVRLARQMIKLSLISQRRLLQFAAVGVTGILVNTLLLILFTEGMGIRGSLATGSRGATGSPACSSFWASTTSCCWRAGRCSPSSSACSASTTSWATCSPSPS
jgi:dolichol-phosphate mannosyltransferase